MNQQNKIREALSNLEVVDASAPLTALVGFDGFLDQICEVVDQRINATEYHRLKTIGEYARRIATAAGKSTNLEFVTKQHKMGGNGPLLSDALGRLGTTVCSVGAFGEEVIHPVYQPLGEYGRQISLCDSAVTIATEFDDGKIMHGMMLSLQKITPEKIYEKFGSKEAFIEELDRAQLVASLNWTMIPNLTSVFEALADLLNGRARRMVFFDLCDPAKRPRADLKAALEVMTRIEQESGQHVILGLNEKESEEVCEALAIECPAEMMTRAKKIRERLQLQEVVVHPVTGAVVSSIDSSEHQCDGPLSSNPMITTGAGDHFNGGYCYGRLAGLSEKDSLITGTATSGFYVRNAHGPSPQKLKEFMQTWSDEKLPDWANPWTTD